MTSTATPKGLRRRGRLIAAAGELLVQGGLDAVRHRAVAERAELPLASTTYYFESLEDLLAEAVAHTCHRDEDAVRARSAALTRRRRGADATAEALADVFVGVAGGPGELVTRCEMVVLAQRFSRLRPLLVNRRKLVAGLHDEVLEKSGRCATPDAVGQLMAVEDGVVAGVLTDTAVGGVVDVVAHAADRTRAALCEVIDILAPVAD